MTANIDKIRESKRAYYQLHKGRLNAHKKEMRDKKRIRMIEKYGEVKRVVGAI